MSYKTSKILAKTVTKPNPLAQETKTPESVKTEKFTFPKHNDYELNDIYRNCKIAFDNQYGKTNTQIMQVINNVLIYYENGKILNDSDWEKFARLLGRVGSGSVYGGENPSRSNVMDKLRGFFSLRNPPLDRVIQIINSLTPANTPQLIDEFISYKKNSIEIDLLLQLDTPNQTYLANVNDVEILIDQKTIDKLWDSSSNTKKKNTDNGYRSNDEIEKYKDEHESKYYGFPEKIYTLILNKPELRMPKLFVEEIVALGSKSLLEVVVLRGATLDDQMFLRACGSLIERYEKIKFILNSYILEVEIYFAFQLQ